MIALIKAELRKNWKTRKFLVAVLCFLIFMGCSYSFCLQKDQEYYDDQTQQLHYENSIAQPLAKMLMNELQATAFEKEPPGLRERAYMWYDAAEEINRWAMLRQSGDYFGYEKITDAANRHSNVVISLRTNEWYQQELDGSGQTLQDVKDDQKYFSYMKEHQINMYSTPYEPNLLNFIMMLFENEMIILLIMVSAFFLIDQICQDFDYGSYKNVYAIPCKRSTIMSAKVISSLIMISVSFFVALLLFAWIPYIQYGVGSMEYPYMRNHQLLTYLPLLTRTIPFVIVILLFYMTICVLVANLFKSTTNTLLFMSGILLIVYLEVQFFGLHHPLLTWLPFFYIYPLDVIFGGYDYSYWVCIAAGILSVIILYLIFCQKMEKTDLKGSGES